MTAAKSDAPALTDAVVCLRENNGWNGEIVFPEKEEMPWGWADTSVAKIRGCDAGQVRGLSPFRRKGIDVTRPVEHCVLVPPWAARLLRLVQRCSAKMGRV